MKGLVRYQNQRPNLFSLFDDMFFGDNNWSRLQNASQPSVNIVEDKDGFTLELAAPGLNRDDFNIQIDDDQLTLSAQIKEEKEKIEGEYRKREFNYSSFSRSFHLDQTIDINRISARYVEGILYVSLPKKEEVKKEVKRIEIG